VRSLQRLRPEQRQGSAGGAIDDVSNNAIQVALFLLVLPFVGVDVDTSQFEDAGPDRRLVIAIAVALVVSAVVVLAVPRIRRRVLPAVRDSLRGLWSVARVRRKRLEVFGGGIASELLYAVALGAS